MSEEIKIKCVKVLTEKEIENASGAIDSIYHLFDKDSWGSIPHRKFDFVDLDGKGNEHLFTEIKPSGCKGCSGFDEDRTLFPVKITYSDGSYEYGFKWYSERWIESKPKLRSLFKKVGVLNSKSRKIESSLDRDDMVPSWVDMYLNYYTGCDKNIAAKFLNEDDLTNIRNVVHSDYISYNPIYSVPPIKERTMKRFPWMLQESKYNDGHWYATMTQFSTEKDGFIKQQYNGRTLYTDGNRYYQRIVKYSYLKSVYDTDSISVKMWHLIPISNIFSIYTEGGKEVWNNMDATLHGKV